MSGQYPQSEMLSQIGTEYEAVNLFLEWLSQEKKYWIAHYPMLSEYEYDENGDPFPTGREYQSHHLVPTPENDRQLVNEFFGIDAEALDKERRDMLEELRKAQE